ncbi:MAG: PorT family protein [Prevotella sp.]|nr:PorT family protein [Prevotella sp.]
MKRLFILSILTVGLVIPMHASTFIDSLSYDIRFAYSIGGSMPIGMPATIRSLDKYSLEANVQVGVDVYEKFSKRWGLATGLRLENKGMSIEATVKNYHMTMVRGGQTLEGRFTGHNATDVTQWMFTLPVQAVCYLGDKWMLRCGPYISYVHSHSFSGHASDGYLRVGDPTGAKVEIGSDENTRGSYDFSDDLRNFQYGVLVGANWRFYKSWGLLVDVSWGLNGIFKSDFHTIEQTFHPIYGTIGLSYHIK